MKYTLTTDDIKAIKRINQRLQYMEDKGYEETNIYKDLQKRIAKSGLNLSTSKTGKLRLSRAINQDIKKGLFTVQQNLEYVERARTLSEERKVIREQPYEGKTIKEKLINKSNFEERLQSHIDDLYTDYMSGNKFSAKLYDYVKGGFKNKSYTTANIIMNLIDNYRETHRPEPTENPIFKGGNMYDYLMERRKNKQRNKRNRNKKNR